MEILRDQDPVEFFKLWLEDARQSEPNDPEAMALATATPDGVPSVRMVLLKGVGPDGFRFFTNMESRKGGELAKNPQVALCLHWKSRLRQVRIEGRVERLPPQDADDYFNSRHPQSRIGAWASRQSQPIPDRAALMTRVEKYAAEFGDDIPRPPYWGGYLVIPHSIEFWQQGDYRLHDRFVFRRDTPQSPWSLTRLSP